MDNNNYNTNLQNINDHIKLSLSDRQNHIDLTTECYGHIITKGPRKGQLSDLGKYAKDSLLGFHNISDFKGYKIHTCHLCPNSSDKPNGFVCINPNHLYFGTASENAMDKSKDTRKAVAVKGGKAAGKLPASNKQKKIASESFKKLFEEGQHPSQKLQTCPHCGKQGKGRIMNRWHFDNCKHK